jgi:cis-3-alkyl-4-acyloxetan-2-one decarboxylase
MHYLDQGEGPPVVMLHGNPNWSFYYRRIMARLMPTHRCLVPDHLGCGLSDKPSLKEYPFTLAERVKDINDWLDFLKLDRPVSLVMHDWGGMIGCAVAVARPEMIDRLVVLNTGAFPLPKSKPVPWQLRLARTPVLGSLLVKGFGAFSEGAVRSCVTRTRMPLDVARAYCAPYDCWEHRVAVHEFVRDIPLKPGDRSWETVKGTADRLDVLAGKPMLIGWGDQDFVFDHHFLAEWKRRFPQARVLQYPECGHYILEDAPEELLEEICQFLK